MKDLINMMAKQQMVEEAVKTYYSQFFSGYPPSAMFEVYDVVREEFVVFPGREGSRVMNRQTLVANLSEMESNNYPVDNLVVINYQDNDIEFDDPAFIGGTDSYYAKIAQ